MVKYKCLSREITEADLNQLSQH